MKIGSREYDLLLIALSRGFSMDSALISREHRWASYFLHSVTTARYYYCLSVCKSFSDNWTCMCGQQHTPMWI